jgi:hypothetical protein
VIRMRFLNSAAAPAEKFRPLCAPLREGEGDGGCWTASPEFMPL